MIYDPLLAKSYGGIETYREKFYDNPTKTVWPERTFSYRLARSAIFQGGAIIVIMERTELSFYPALVGGLLVSLAISDIADRTDSYTLPVDLATTVVETA